MSELATKNDETMIIPAFGKMPQMSFVMNSIRTAEQRLIEAKDVNPLTYSDLEHSFNEAYRELKKYLSQIQYGIAQAEKSLEEAKANILLDRYPAFLEEKQMKKTQDNADLRKAFMMRDKEYTDALDRVNQLKALESNFDGKLKVMERACAYMKKKMDLIIRSGLSDPKLYVTGGKK
jgi:hypothetical protein